MKMKMPKVSEIQLAYKPHPMNVKVTNSEIAAGLLREAWPMPIELKEVFSILLLNRQNQPIGLHTVSSGGLSQTVVDPRFVFVPALLANSDSIILAHNHPSGNLRPSEPDLDLTRKLLSGSELLGLRIIDHIIITADSYHSMRDNESVVF